MNTNGDTYNQNDSILNYVFYNQPMITSFPYAEDFEKNDGHWYATGQNNSWQYGIPSSPLINNAASGSKVWKTGLTGEYNNLETSYLYSPCFDVSALRQPVFKMSNAMDIENCGEILCDAAYVQYSTDGINWNKLGKAGEGFQWYNNDKFDVWSEEDRTYWLESQVPIPAPASFLKFRVVFNSDVALTKEGLAVDDIEIFDYYQLNMLLDVFPNPTRNKTFTIRWTATAGTDVQVSLTDITGREVYSDKAITYSDKYNEKTISTPQLATGVYILKCRIGDREATEKIVLL